jgi:hypothetical protein
MHSALPDSRLAIRFIKGSDQLQDSGHSGGVLRGITQDPPVIHASGMAVRPRRLLHLISVRTGLVRRGCYYILYGKASSAPYLDLDHQNDEYGPVPGGRLNRD